MKTSILLFAILGLTIFALAQTKKTLRDRRATKVPAPYQDARRPAVLDIKVGTGAVAQTGQTVKVHYTGWLTSGKEV